MSRARSGCAPSGLWAACRSNQPRRRTSAWPSLWRGGQYPGCVSGLRRRRFRRAPRRSTRDTSANAVHVRQHAVCEEQGSKSPHESVEEHSAGDRVDIGPHRPVQLARDDQLGESFVAAPLGVCHAVYRGAGGEGRAPHDEERPLVGSWVFEHLEVGVYGEEHLMSADMLPVRSPWLRRACRISWPIWPCARSAKRETSTSLEPKWCVGRPRLTPARPPMLANDAPCTPRSAMSSAAASKQGIFGPVSSLRLAPSLLRLSHSHNLLAVSTSKQVRFRPCSATPGRPAGGRTVRGRGGACRSSMS